MTKHIKLFAFSGRTIKEILRDPLNFVFGIGFPVILILLLSAIQANIPVSLFEIETLAPGITIFGLSFMTLFSATLVAKDRESALLQRLYTTPLQAADETAIRKVREENGHEMDDCIRYSRFGILL